jgi:hypothetical protein
MSTKHVKFSLDIQTHSTSVESADDSPTLYNFQPNEVIAGKYKALTILGDGAFGRVLDVEELGTANRFAMKIVGPIRENVKYAKVEAKILKRIMMHPDRSERIV